MLQPAGPTTHRHAARVGTVRAPHTVQLCTTALQRHAIPAADEVRSEPRARPPNALGCMQQGRAAAGANHSASGVQHHAHLMLRSLQRWRRTRAGGLLGGRRGSPTRFTRISCSSSDSCTTRASEVCSLTFCRPLRADITSGRRPISGSHRCTVPLCPCDAHAAEW